MEDSSYSNLSRSGIKSYDITFSKSLAGFGQQVTEAISQTIGPKSPNRKEMSKFKGDISNQQSTQEFVNLIEDKIGEDLRYSMFFKEYEEKLQENSEELFKNLLQKMIANYKENTCKLRKKRSEGFRLRKLQMLQQLQEDDNITVLEETRQEPKFPIINEQAIENMNRILEEQNKANARFAAITDSYSEITNLVQNEPLAEAILEKYISPLNIIMSNLTVIMEFSETGTITDKEVKQCDILLSNIENIKQKIIDDIAIAKQQELLKEQMKEEEARKKKIQELKEQEQKAAENIRIQQTLLEQAKRAQSMFYSHKNYAHYKELKHFLDCYENSYKDLLENTNLKKFRFDCQKAVNTPVNALSSVSGMHMRDKFDKLAKLLRGEKVQVLDTFVTASQHPQGLHYCTALLAKKIVRQGDLLVSSNPEAAFPLAAVTVALWSQFPEFGKLIEANFHRQCPYIVPMMLPQKEEQTDKEFYLSRGYTYNDEGVVEKHDKFLKRMSGIFRLHCAIWIAKTPKFINASNPCGLRYGWQWIASFINLKPEPDISATLIHDFFTVCGSQFFKYYGKQCIKIIKLLSTEYLAILQNIDEGGPKTRFEVFLQNVLNTNCIPPPNGLLPLNTW